MLCDLCLPSMTFAVLLRDLTYGPYRALLRGLTEGLRSIEALRGVLQAWNS